MEGEVVVKLGQAATLEQVYDKYPQVDRTGTETFLNSSKIYLLRLGPGSDTEQTASDMAGDSALFLYAEPNFTTDAPEGDIRHRARGDSDPEFSTAPEPYSTQYAVDALNLSSCARNISKGEGTTVAVLDTGVQRDHPILRDSLVDGYDFIDDDADPSEASAGLMKGHGTHVAGVVHLTAPDARIMPMRVLDQDGIGNVFVIAEAIREAVDPDGDPNTKDGVDVINMSLGSSQESNLIQDVTDDIDAVEDDDDDDDDDTGPALDPRSVPAEGVVVVASAGNEGTDPNYSGDPRYPAAEVGVLAVASVGEDEKKSDFSNFGSWVDIAAPGDDIYSTVSAGKFFLS